MHFSRVVSVHDKEYQLRPNDIASVDLDMFRSCAEKREYEALKERISWLVQPAKLIMFFTSPTWILVEDANRYVQELADRLIVD